MTPPPTPRRPLGVPGAPRPEEYLPSAYAEDPQDPEGAVSTAEPTAPGPAELSEEPAAGGDESPAATAPEPAPVAPVAPADARPVGSAGAGVPGSRVGDAGPAAPAGVPGPGRSTEGGGGAAAEDRQGAEPLDPAQLRGSLEAILMVVDEPIGEERLAGVLDLPRAEVRGALRELADEYAAQGRGFDLRFVAGGWRFYTRAEFSEAVDRFVLDGQQSRLTQAALETLAVVAYRQPVSRARVSAVRGVNCDGVMRTLVQRGLVEEAGSESETGAILYRTTNYFLERMGLRGLDELPELAPFLPEAEDVEADSQEGSIITEAVAEAVVAAQSTDSGTRDDDGNSDA